MYEKRVKVFIGIMAGAIVICMGRLVQMQLLSDSSLQDKIASLKFQRGASKQFKTLRGKILDRQGKVLATDELQYQLCIEYDLSSFLDQRVSQAKQALAARRTNSTKALSELADQVRAKLEDLEQVIDKCTYFGLSREETESRIDAINERIWKLRMFQAWRQNCQGSQLFEKYKDNFSQAPAEDFAADFETRFPDVNERLALIGRTDIAEMHQSWMLLDLQTEDDVFTAQMEFMDIDGAEVSGKTWRFYPYGSSASQTIGWVGQPQDRDRKVFENDRLLRYEGGEVCGRDDGVEYVCEGVLRGRRGESVVDIDNELVRRTERAFGKDVQLTIDIDLQERIEGYLMDCDFNPNCRQPTAAVVMDVASGEILALVSVPVFDLNRVRSEYGRYATDANEPLRNRALNQQYPGGSVIKPLILIAGLESGKVSADEVIGCPSAPAGVGWPNCWIYNMYHTGHDMQWTNNARNAIKGSCNIYFSRLADRLEPWVLQNWLYKFGYGRRVLHVPEALMGTEAAKDFRQMAGVISTVRATEPITSFEQVPPLSKGERRLFGIGQGNLRVTVLQAANAMAAIAREGFYKNPRLIMGEDSNDAVVDMGISRETLRVVYDGMSAVVNEPEGTAFKEFSPAAFWRQGVDVYGKTGSTERPDNAWFSGFANDRTGRSIVIAVLVEGGQHGSADAAPLARDIIQFCIEAGYIGQGTGAER